MLFRGSSHRGHPLLAVPIPDKAPMLLIEHLQKTEYRDAKSSIGTQCPLVFSDPPKTAIFGNFVILQWNEGSNMKAVEVQIPVAGGFITADLHQPDPMDGLVLFAHGSGSSRHSPRNQFVAQHLNHRGFATLLIDLLTPEEEAVDVQTREYRFNISLLSQRVITSIDWIRAKQDFADVPLGCFGASTGAAAALIAAAERPEDVAAVVSRGGRVDLAGAALSRVLCPVLLIVGELDKVVLDINRLALNDLTAPVKKLVVIPGASHLFEEPGTLEQVAEQAALWFEHYLRRETWDG